jgi:hypothetical protein
MRWSTALNVIVFKLILKRFAVELAYRLWTISAHA